MQTPPALTTVAFGDYQVTRLISGANPLTGGSHWSNERSREMREYHTPERVVAYLKRLTECGVNTIQARGDFHRIMYWLELFKREGGQIQWIAQTASEMHDVFQNIRVITAAGAIAIYLHGSRTDRLWADGRIDRANDYLKHIRDQGLLVGLGTHTPEVIEYAEGKGWDIDFYMASFYNPTVKIHAGDSAPSLPQPDEVHDDRVPTVNELFSDDAPTRMCKAIRSTDKQCLAFKVLGAARRCTTQDDVKAAFRYAYANIKPQDIVVVGMWQKHRDEIAMNVRYAQEAMVAAT